jgi:signal transduction histidine kinase/ActR/RegA family two-component response regulator
VTTEKRRERDQALSGRLEAILEGVADGISVQDRSGRVIFANTAAAKVCGFSSVEGLLEATPEEVVGRFEILDERGNPFPGEDLPGRRVLAGAGSASAVLRVRERASGREWWSAVRATALLDADGKPELAINIWNDVSAQRRAEEHERYLAQAAVALSSSLDYEAMLATLAGLLVPGLADWCSIHLLEGEVLENVTVAHVDPEKLAVAHEHQRRYPPDRAAPHGVWSVLRSGESEVHAEISDEMLVQGARDAAHLEILRSVGMQSVALVPIRTRERVLGTLSLISAQSGRRYQKDDITLLEELGRRAGTAIENVRLYAAEKKAREQLELLARAGEAFSGALDYEETLRSVVRITLPMLGDFAFFDVVEGAEVRRLAAAHDDPVIDALIGQTRWVRSERKDKNLCALSSGDTGFHPDTDDAWKQDVATGPEHLDVLRQLALGSMITVPLRARGEVLGSLTVCFGKSGRRHTRDDVKLAEEVARRAGIAVVQVRLYEEAQAAAKRAEEASRIKDEFLATVSHELRTPLNAIVGWSTLLRDRSKDPSLAKGIDVIHRNAQAQRKIIEDILDVSRVITGNLRLELKPADLVAIVRDSIEVLRPSATAKRITMELTPPADIGLVVADPERLQQVVWNLLSNAVKFTDTGGIVVGIQQERSKLVLSVTDTGRGIDADFLPFAFERFKQADGSTTRRVGGLGLGLAIVRHIVELHGGQVRAESAGPGAGATFTMTLPIRAVVPAAEDGAMSSSRRGEQLARAASNAMRGLRVLVVDDEPDARDLLEAVIAEAGGTVHTAATASEGIELLQRFRPHVVVSDIGMPEEDGYGFMRRVRALDPSLGGGIPAIALTAYTRGDDVTRALSAGFTTHLGKPVNPDDLVAAVVSLARLSPRRPGS